MNPQMQQQFPQGGMDLSPTPTSMPSAMPSATPQMQQNPQASAFQQALMASQQAQPTQAAEQIGASLLQHPGMQPILQQIGNLLGQMGHPLAQAFNQMHGFGEQGLGQQAGQSLTGTGPLGTSLTGHGEPGMGNQPLYNAGKPAGGRK